MSVKVNYGSVIKEIQMTQHEIDYVVKNIDQTKPIKMTEWGSGGSTIKWLETLPQNSNLCSVEHNKDWYEKVCFYINQRPDLKNKLIYHRYPEKYGYKHGYANITEEHPYGLENYLKPNYDVFDSDIYFVDGIGRAACLAYIKIYNRTQNPIIYLHDYKGREDWYAWGVNLFSKKEIVADSLLRLWL